MSEEHMVMAGRLLAAVLAGGLIGLERGFRGRPAAAMRCNPRRRSRRNAARCATGNIEHRVHTLDRVNFAAISRADAVLPGVIRGEQMRCTNAGASVADQKDYGP